MPKHSIKLPVKHEIIENMKNFHETQFFSPKEKGAEELGGYCDSSQVLMVFCLLQF